MATSPNNEVPHPEIPAFNWNMWWEDAEAKANAIIEQMGDDRSTDEHIRHDAVWADSTEDRSFLLTRITVNEYRYFYLAVMTRIGEDKNTRYEFNSDMRGISEVEGGDWLKVETEHVVNGNGFELLAPKLTSYLETAPVNFSKTSAYPLQGKDLEYEEAFWQAVVSYVADEDLVRQEILSRPTDESVTRPVYQSYFAVCNIMRTTFGLSDELVRQAIDLGEQRIIQGQ